MYEGNPVDLKMEKTVSMEAVFDEETHHCKIFKYDVDEDYIYLLLEKESLTAISLDAKYQCDIATKKELLSCSGVVKERFQSEKGSMLIFQIENGFYCVEEKNGRNSRK